MKGKRQKAKGKNKVVFTREFLPFAFCLLPFNLNHRGFTLLEILIAISILGVITGIIASSLHVGILSWERGETATERYQRIRILVDEVSQQIKSIYPYKAQGIGKPKLIFLGGERTLGFTTTLVSQGLKEERGGFEFVYYELDDERGLIKREKIIFSGDISIKDLGDPIELDSEVSELKFEYYEEEENKDNSKSGQWVDSWDGESKDKLPQAIRATLGFRFNKDKTGSSDPSSDKITFTVPIFTEPKPILFSVNPLINNPAAQPPDPLQ